jgi:hypothetical protein
LGGFKLILGQITGQTELLIFLILGWATNVDLVVSWVGVDVVVFSISLHQRHFIWRERLELFLPLRNVSDDGSCGGPARSRRVRVSNQLISHMDWLPTLLAAAGEPEIKEKLLKGHQVGAKTFKVSP